MSLHADRFACKPLIRAELRGASHCTAAGVTASGYMPVLAICRALVHDGIDPATSLECYRGDVLCLTVRAIGQPAGLEIRGHGVGFRHRPKLGIAPPIAPIAAEGGDREQPVSRKPGKFHKRAIRRHYRGKLRGFGAQQLFRQRGLKGTTLGPANAGRRLSGDECKAIEKRSRDEGLLP